MAYMVGATKLAPGIATCELTQVQAFTVVAASFVVDTNSGNTPPYWLDYRDPSGDLIDIQCAGQADSNMPTLVSLGPGKSNAATIDQSGVALFPGVPQAANNVLTAPLSMSVPLEPGCTVNAYVAQPLAAGGSPDPIGYIDTGAEVRDLRLWVEDVVGAGVNVESVPVGPYMLVPGPGA